jgi:hypothetical protein
MILQDIPQYMTLFKGFKGALKKYGRDNFKWEILSEANVDLLSAIECYYIAYFRSYDPKIGYNLTMGGDGAPYGELNPSKRPEVKEKIRLASSKYRHKDYTLKIISEKSKNYYKYGMQQWLKDKISIGVKKANKPPRSGKESLLAKSCRLINPDGVEFEVVGIRGFADENKLDHSSISKLLNGKLKTHKGWRSK